MLYIDFCRAPKGVWVGCIQYNNERVFSHGRTLDLLVSNMKAMVNHTWRKSAASVILSSKDMERDEFEQKHLIYASPTFKGRYWNKEKEKTEMSTIKLPKDNKIKKVVVDGVLYKNITSAEKELGIRINTLGHTVAYADNLPQFQITKKEEEMPKTKQEEKKGNYTYEEKDGVLYVYEKKLVAKYEIEKK